MQNQATNTIELLKQLIAVPSVTPYDHSCQDIIADYLAKVGFSIERFRVGKVDNLWARLGTQSPLLVFAGHTDVVPAGNVEAWNSDPFQAEIRDGKCYGRGAVDMKGAVACMLTAVEEYLSTHSTSNNQPKGSIGFLITSGEEGDDYLDGTPQVMQMLYEKSRAEKIDYCILGEPSCYKHIGDNIRIGRRGSMTAKVTITGTQGHVAYPQLAENPIHTTLNCLHELAHYKFDNGDDFFPASNLQITNLQVDGNAVNIIPGKFTAEFSLRYSPALSIETLQKIINQLFSKQHLPVTIEWKVNAKPFLSKPGQLAEAAKQIIEQKFGITPKFSTDGGTSDGRFIVPYGVELIELGLTNATIHQVNECVGLDELEQLEIVYQQILKKMFDR